MKLKPLERTGNILRKKVSAPVWVIMAMGIIASLAANKWVASDGGDSARDAIRDKALPAAEVVVGGVTDYLGITDATLPSIRIGDDSGPYIEVSPKGAECNEVFTDIEIEPNDSPVGIAEDLGLDNAGTYQQVGDEVFAVGAIARVCIQNS